MGKVPLIEQFQEKCMKSFYAERVFARAREEGNSVLNSRPMPLILHEIEKSVKYRFTPSATLMYYYLYETPSIDPDYPQDLQRTWIEYEEPFTLEEGLGVEGELGSVGVGGLYLTQFPPYEVAKTIPDMTETMLQLAKRYAGYWYIIIFDGNLRPAISALYYPIPDSWYLALPAWWECPCGGGCEYINLEDATAAAVIPCNNCRDLMGTCIRSLTLHLGIARGQFAEQPESSEVRVKSETTFPKGSKHKQEKPVTRKYMIISFDASVKKKVASPGEPRTHRQSWLEIDPEAVLYVDRSILETQRVLDPARNPRWKKKQIVPVKAHRKKIPIKLTAIRRVKSKKHEVQRALEQSTK